MKTLLKHTFMHRISYSCNTRGAIYDSNVVFQIILRSSFITIIVININEVFYSAQNSFTQNILFTPYNNPVNFQDRPSFLFSFVLS